MGNDNSKATIENQQLIMQLQQQLLKQQQQQQSTETHKNQTSHNNNGNGNGNFINNLLQNPTLIAKIENNPSAKRKLLEKLITEYRHLMTQQQMMKITQMLNSLPPAQNEYIPQQYTAPQNIGVPDVTSINSGMAFNQGSQTFDPHSRALQTQKQFSTANALKTHYRSEEEAEEAAFKREEERRRAEFQERQRQRRAQYQSQLLELEKNDVDALKLFQLPKNYSLDELKTAYKRLAMKSHPDKPTGNKEQFQLVTKCYMLLLEKYKNRESDRTFADLRSASKKYIEEQGVSQDKSKYLDKTKFDVKLFNKIYEENKLWDSNDDGYNDFMKTGEKEDETPAELFGNKFNLNIFNSTFENYKEKMAGKYGDMQIQEYKEPKELVSCSTGFTEIDTFGKKISDFSKALPVGSSKKELAFTDLKTAYTARGAFIDPSKVEYTTYKSIDELKRARSNVKYDMTPEQMAEYEARKMREAEEEEIRQQRIRERDNLITSSYGRIHERMLGYKGSAPS